MVCIPIARRRLNRLFFQSLNSAPCQSMYLLYFQSIGANHALSRSFRSRVQPPCTTAIYKSFALPRNPFPPPRANFPLPSRRHPRPWILRHGRCTPVLAWTARSYFSLRSITSGETTLITLRLCQTFLMGTGVKNLRKHSSSPRSRDDLAFRLTASQFRGSFCRSCRWMFSAIANEFPTRPASYNAEFAGCRPSRDRRG
jgi:hypothetical protein